MLIKEYRMFPPEGAAGQYHAAGAATWKILLLIENLLTTGRETVPEKGI